MTEVQALQEIATAIRGVDLTLVLIFTVLAANYFITLWKK